MKLTHIITEKHSKPAEPYKYPSAGEAREEARLADEKARKERIEKMSPEERAAHEKFREEAKAKQEAYLARRRGDASQQCKGDHDWVSTSSTAKGLHSYKCKNCTATKQVDSSD